MFLVDIKKICFQTISPVDFSQKKKRKTELCNERIMYVYVVSLLLLLLLISYYCLSLFNLDFPPYL